MSLLLVRDGSHAELLPTCSGQSESITIKSYKDRLSDIDVDRMAQDVADLAAQDEARRTHVLVLNQLQNYVSKLTSVW